MKISVLAAALVASTCLGQAASAQGATTTITTVGPAPPAEQVQDMPMTGMSTTTTGQPVLSGSGQVPGTMQGGTSYGVGNVASPAGAYPAGSPYPVGGTLAPGVTQPGIPAQGGMPAAQMSDTEGVVTTTGPGVQGTNRSP